MEDLILAAEVFVRAALAQHDASHDFNHIARVRRMARAIAIEEGMAPEQVQVVELAALLHDVADWKYQAEADAPSQAQVVEVGMSARQHSPRPFAPTAQGDPMG